MRYVDVGRAALVIREKVMKEPANAPEGMLRYRFTPEDEVTLASFRPVLHNVDLDAVNLKNAELGSYAKRLYAGGLDHRQPR